MWFMPGEKCLRKWGFLRAFKKEGMGVQLEDTTHVTTQQNFRFEQKFATVFNTLFAMLNSGILFSFLRNGLWAEVANTATPLQDHQLTPTRDLAYCSNIFGRERSPHKAKEANHGTPGIFFGFHRRSSSWYLLCIESQNKKKWSDIRCDFPGCHMVSGIKLKNQW